MISSTQAAEYLDKKLGIAAASFELAAAREKVEAVEASMLAVYTEADTTLMQALAVAVIVGTGSRAINSQSAPSGASRSFKNRDDALSEMRRQLEALDTDGLLTDVVGPDPVGGAFFLVAA